MGFMGDVLEHSKKVGRITALMIILGVAGTISIIMVNNDPASAKEILKDWIQLAGIAITFYFIAPKATS